MSETVSKLWEMRSSVLAKLVVNKHGYARIYIYIYIYITVYFILMSEVNVVSRRVATRPALTHMRPITVPSSWIREPLGL